MNQCFKPTAHSPDNSFLGFAVPKTPQVKKKKHRRLQNKAIIYGKGAEYFEVRGIEYNIRYRHIHQSLSLLLSLQ